MLFAKDVDKITIKPSPSEKREWSDKIKFFRAVEDYCHGRLLNIIHNDKVWSWLNKPIEKYEDMVKSIVEDLEESKIKDFILEHAAGSHGRIRGAALYSTLVDNLDKIALNEFDVDELILEADEKLQTYLDINIESFRNLAVDWRKEMGETISFYYANLPTYLKEIVSAVELLRRNKPEYVKNNPTVKLREIPYQPENYQYLSKAIDRLKKLKKKDRLNDLMEYFKVKIMRDSKGEWIAEILDVNPIQYINPLGKLVNGQISEYSQGVEP